MCIIEIAVEHTRKKKMTTPNNLYLAIVLETEQRKSHTKLCRSFDAAFWVAFNLTRKLINFFFPFIYIYLHMQISKIIYASRRLYSTCVEYKTSK